MPVNRRDLLRWTPAALSLLAASELHAANSTQKPRIKIGQIGLGHGHATKLSVYRQSPDYEVVGIVEPDPELRARYEHHPAFTGFPWMTREQLLQTSGLQAVLIETRVRDLLDNAEACVSAGMHIHLDKPAGQSLLQLRRIHETAAQSNLLIQMGYMYRYNPAIVMLRDFLRRGWLGEVFEIHAVMSKVVDPGSRKELAQYGGGMMFELGCHLLDLVINILGKPERVTGYLRHSSSVDDGLLDNTLAVLEYPKTTATIRSSALEVEGFDRRHLVVCGSEGTFHIQPLDAPSARISLSQDRRQDDASATRFDRGTQEIRFPPVTRYVDDAIDMAKIIRGEKSSDFSSQHDLDVQETLLRACGYPLE